MDALLIADNCKNTPHPERPGMVHSCVCLESLLGRGYSDANTGEIVIVETRMGGWSIASINSSVFATIPMFCKRASTHNLDKTTLFNSKEATMGFAVNCKKPTTTRLLNSTVEYLLIEYSLLRAKVFHALSLLFLILSLLALTFLLFGINLLIQKQEQPISYRAKMGKSLIA